MTPSSKIIIIGAGLSGLTAAYRLQKLGHDVHVYEARHRPGGRILTAVVGKGIEELGGKNFLDSGDPDHSLPLIEELGLEPLQYEIPRTPTYVNGTFSTSVFNILRKFTDIKGLRSKIEDAAATSQNLQEVIDTVFKDPDLRLLFTGSITMYEGSDPQRLEATSFESLYTLSTSIFKAMMEADAGHTPTLPWFTIKGGNAQLPLTLSKKLKNKIHYGHALTAVQQNEQKIILEFNNATEIETDVVLLTIPCSLFKDIHFGRGTVPIEQLRQIQMVQYATNAKILFSFAELPKKHELITSDFVITWSNYEDNVRTFYYGGNNGIFDSKEAHSIFDKSFAIIKTVYPELNIPSIKLEPAKDSQLATYKEAVFKSWISDPFAKGSYSNHASGATQWLKAIETIKGENVRKLFRPVNDKIFFAGEHATILDALGTMGGAIESGERLARLIDKTLMV